MPMCPRTADCCPRQSRIIIIPAIRPKHSSSPSAVTPDTASRPYNRPHAGQREDRDPRYIGDKSEVPEAKFWPEAAQEVAKQGIEPGLLALHLRRPLPRAIFVK